MNKEFWNKLSSEEKTKAIRHFLKSQDLIDFDYDKILSYAIGNIIVKMGEFKQIHSCILPDVMLAKENLFIRCWKMTAAKKHRKTKAEKTKKARGNLSEKKNNGREIKSPAPRHSATTAIK